VPVADIAFAIALELHDVLATVLTEADDGAALGPALCLWVLDDDGLTRVEDRELMAVLDGILVLANLAKSTFDLGAKNGLVVVDRCWQAVSDFAAKKELGRREAGRLARSVVIE